MFYFPKSKNLPSYVPQRRERTAALQWHQDSVLLTGAAIVSPLHKSSHCDRRWSSSHSAHPRHSDLRAGSFPQAPTHTKRVGGGAASSTIEVTQACATLVLSSYSIYSISIVDHRHQRRGGRGEAEGAEGAEGV